jgi:hypothetical protein
VHKAELAPGMDIVVLPRGGDLTFAEAHESMASLGRDLARRLKLSTSGSSTPPKIQASP